MPISGTTRYDQYLTDLAISYPQGNLIGEIVAPIKTTDSYSAKIFVDSDELITQLNDVAEGTPAQQTDSSVGTPYSYRTTRKALSEVLLEKQVANQASVVKGEQRITNKKTAQLKLAHEVRVATVLTDSNKVTQTESLSGTARWDSTAPDTEATIITACKTIQDACGIMANTIVIPFQAALYLAKQTFVKNSLQNSAWGMDYLTAQIQGQMMQLVGLPPVLKGLKVVISSGRKNNANKGQTKSAAAIWGTNCLIGYVPPNINVEDVFGIATMEYDSLKVFKEMKTNPRGTEIIVEWDYDILEADLSCWYLVKTVIS